MTIRGRSAVAGALLSGAVLASVAGCQRTASEEQQKVEAAKRGAEQKAAEAQKTAQTEITSAQMEADKKIAKTDAAFEKTRTAYRDDLKKSVSELDKKVEKITAKAQTATGDKKAEIDAALPNIRERQQALHAGMATIDSATMQTWDVSKNKVDTDKKALSDAIDQVPFLDR